MTVILILVGAFWTISKGLVKGLENLEIREQVKTIQTIALLRSTRIRRRVLETWGGLLSLKLYLLYIDLRPGQTYHSKDGRICIFRWRRRAWLTIWNWVKIPSYSHKLMQRKRVTCELHDSYFRLMMIKTRHSKDGGSCIFRWPFMGRDWVDVELSYNSVHRKFNQSWRNDAVEKTAPSRRGP